MLAPRDECVGAIVVGFMPRDDGGATVEQTSLRSCSADGGAASAETAERGHELVKLNGNDVKVSPRARGGSTRCEAVREFGVRLERDLV